MCVLWLPVGPSISTQSSVLPPSPHLLLSSTCKIFSLFKGPPLKFHMFYTTFFFFFFGLFRAAPAHVEVPRLGVESELLLPTYTTARSDPSHVCDLHHSSQQHWIFNPLSRARDRTQVLMDTSWVCYCWATMGTPTQPFLSLLSWWETPSPTPFRISVVFYLFFLSEMYPLFLIL